MAINLGEFTKSICVQCGSEAYKYKGKVYRLCARCRWEVIVKALNYIEPESDEDKYIDMICDITIIGCKDGSD